MSHRLPCEFIQDMLPLYIDGIAGRASDEAIREHIAGCSECREMLEQMQQAKELQEALDRQQEIRDIDYMKMLMYGKEASNRKQEIDRQHYTIPNQRPKDKHCGKI